MSRWVLFTALVLTTTPALAQEGTGYVVANVNLHAGPDIGYPIVDLVPEGAPIYINGCTQAYEWCDVVFQDEHGWVDGNYIQYDYDNRPVYLPRYGAAIGIPIIGFSIGTYWNRWYGSRPFYRERQRWYRYAPPHRRMPSREPSRADRDDDGHRHAGDYRPSNPGYHESQQGHQDRPQRPQQNRSQRYQHASPPSQLPREATRPTAGPIHAVPGNRGAYQPAPAHRGGDGDGGHSDHGGDHRNSRGDHQDDHGH